MGVGDGQQQGKGWRLGNAPEADARPDLAAVHKHVVSRFSRV